MSSETDAIEDDVASEESTAVIRTPRSGLEPHPFRVTPFVFGIAFACVGVVGLTDFSSDRVTGWLWVIALVVFGVAGITAAVGRRAESG